MSRLRVAMDAAFWDLTLSSAQTLDASARAVPGEPIPLHAAPTCRVLRPQQLSLLGNGFPLGIIPSFSPTAAKELGSFAIQSLLFKHQAPDWWVGFVGQFRPQKLITSIKAEVMEGDEMEVPAFKDVAKHFIDKSLYSVGLCSQLSLSPSSSLFFSTEMHGHKKGCRSRAIFNHELPYHDVTLEVAWPELFLDSKGAYWDVPASISLDLSSHASESGLRYRLGLHKSSSQPQPLSTTCGEVPTALLPGVCAKVALSYEKSMDFWREAEPKKKRTLIKKKVDPASLSYDERLKEPHAAISGIIGVSCTSWLDGTGKQGGIIPLSLDGKERSIFASDAFGSVCYTLQHGKFKKDFRDLTRMDARVDVSSASTLIKGAKNLLSDMCKGSSEQKAHPHASPRFSLIFQQQIAGPIVFRADSRLSLHSPSGRPLPHVEDTIYSLNYHLRLLGSGKVVAWYSPKRREGMIELRMYEF